MPKVTTSLQSDRFRLQVELTNERMSAIDSLVKVTGMGSRKEFFDNALALMAWAIREREKGRIIASVDHDDSNDYREILMPCLAHLSHANVISKEEK
mgnify:CR=1 FL=1